ncbi:hypothetical protein LZ32DRAFT_357104 [Colletotrichum eremochloae]|nr:hypothetical protein LZ32DRAFT_357104 [Colletotrichum eremochloae]
MSAGSLVWFFPSKMSLCLSFRTLSGRLQTKMWVSSLKLGNVSLWSNLCWASCNCPFHGSSLAWPDCFRHHLPSPALAKWHPGFLVDIGWFRPVGPTSQFFLPA